MAKSNQFKSIQVKGAKTHNLKDVDVEIPLNKITCIYGPSGSGKSSLAFHTLLAESKRRYLNSLPNDVKFFWNMPTAADVDSILPVLPVWGLAQSNPILGSRPNIADTIGLSDFLQKLFFDFARESCPTHKAFLEEVDWIELFKEGFSDREDNLVFHFMSDRGTYEEKFGGDAIPVRSFDFETSEVRSFEADDLYWEVFRLKLKGLDKLPAKLKEAGLSTDDVYYHIAGDELGIAPLPMAKALKCPHCDYQKTKYNFEPTEFSPYNAAGACQKCSGHGMNLEYDRAKIVKYPYLSIEEGAISLLESSHFRHLLPRLKTELRKKKISLTKPFELLDQKKVWEVLDEGSGNFPGLQTCYDYLESKRYKRTVRIFSRRLKSEVLCTDCEGTRVNRKVHQFILSEGHPLNYKEIWKLTSSELLGWFEDLEKEFEEKRRIKPIIHLLKVACDLGLAAIPLWKKSKFISSSEYQRALLTKILSYEGSGSLFILDEPSYDLSIDEQKSLFKSLEKVKDQGNTILLVEHSELLRALSDHHIEMGPGAGPRGGEVLMTKQNRTKKLPTYKKFKPHKKSKSGASVTLGGFSFQEWEFKPFTFPLGETSVVFGNSGSFKNYYFYKFLANTLSFAIKGEPIESMADVRDELIKNKELPLKDIIVFDSSVGKVSSRSTVGTTIGLSPQLRMYLSNLPVSKELALEKGHFSPNSDLGRCPTCEGKGVKEVEMSFLEDIILSCDDCGGKKLKPFIANISDGQFTVYELFNLPMSEVIPRLSLTPKFKKLWEMVLLLKLDYLSLDRPLSSLSGGERLRVKLLAQLSKKLENSLLVFDNISSGLSSGEVEKIFSFLDSLKHDGNTLLIVDQNPVVLAMAPNLIEFS